MIQLLTQQNLEFQAKRLGCDLNDPACYAQAKEEVIKLKRVDGIENKVVPKAIENLEKSLTDARGLSDRIVKIDDAFKILKGVDGKPITGSFADVRTGAAKLAELFGLSSEKAVQASEALQANNMGLAGELLASGMFGAGTGISDKDMETALKMGGADMALTYGGMIRILTGLRKAAVNKLTVYNKDLSSLKSNVFDQAGYERGRYAVPIPEEVQATPTSPNEDAEYKEWLRTNKGKGAVK